MRSEQLMRFSLVCRVAALGALLGVSALRVDAASIDAPPRIISNDLVDVIFMYVESDANISGRKSAFLCASNGSNFCWSKLRERMVHAIAKSVFTGRISNVIGLRSEKQMVGIDARWVVALVAHTKTSWNRTSMEFPCQAMRFNSLSVVSEFAVAVARTASPDPARIGFFDALPERVFQPIWSMIGAVDTAKSASPITTMAFVNFEAFAA